MSSSLTNVKPWLTLILDSTTPEKQRRAIFDTLSDSQLQALTEIFHNLLHNPELELDKKLERKLKSKKWKTLGNHKLSFARRKKFAKDNKKDILEVLCSIRDLLHQILDYE